MGTRGATCECSCRDNAASIRLVAGYHHDLGRRRANFLSSVMTWHYSLKVVLYTVAGERLARHRMSLRQSHGVCGCLTQDASFETIKPSYLHPRGLKHDKQTRYAKAQPCRHVDM